MTTDRNLIAAAMELLDKGGEHAVTLRAVGHTAGLSHNAPYKHFKNRDALLAAVAATDFTQLGCTFVAIHHANAAPTKKLKDALEVVIDYSIQHPARYRLMFSDSGTATEGGVLEQSAAVAFGAFIAIIEECQMARQLPDIPTNQLAGLLFATLHGLIAFEANGRMHTKKGLAGVLPSIELFIALLVPSP